MAPKRESRWLVQTFRTVYSFRLPKHYGPFALIKRARIKGYDWLRESYAARTRAHVLLFYIKDGGQ